MIRFIQVLRYRRAMGVVGACAAMAILSGSAAYAGPLRVEFRMLVEQAPPGSTNRAVEIDLENTGPGTETVSAYSVAVRVDPHVDLMFTGATPDTDAPYVFAGNSTGQMFSTQAGIVTDSAAMGSVTLAGNSTYGLAVLFYSIPADVPPSTIVTLSFDTGTSVTNGSGDTDPDLEIGPDCTILISSVPEPTSLAMAGSATVLVAGVVCVQRRRKKD